MSIEGPAPDVEAVRRAIEISATKYCSVGATLSSGMTEISHGYVVRDGAGVEQAGDVIVLGPGADPVATAAGPRVAAAVAG